MVPVGYLPCHMPIPLTQLLGTRYPIVSAPMGAIAGGARAPAGGGDDAAIARLRHEGGAGSSWPPAAGDT